MRIAITGATGFLGRYIARRLKSESHDLRCWHRDKNRIPADLADCDWQPGALADAASAAKLVDGVDAVVHAALEWPGSRRDSRPAGLIDFAQTNLLGSLMLMEAGHRAGVKRFVFISTCAVHDRILTDRPLDEAHPLWPYGHYGAHKAAVEAFVHSFGMGKGWSVCSLRPTGIYGLTEPVENSKWYGLVKRVLAGEAIAEAEGGKEVHASDVAAAVNLLLRTDEKAIRGEAFNCCDMYISQQRVAQIARELSGSGSTVAELNRGPKNQIETGRIRTLGMTFGGEPLLRQTIAQMIDHARQRQV